ncbi:anthranilate synthase component II [Ectobacillus ponti]|uniref:Aminodeoxychorismate/anthranilate synthase component II n=1 Tax=Ectobacillus ponti TaxID=2961894 RepID=A0AA41X3P6_9BACI|nr:aminodeoxychorismate/anthranilate synthase component II [Ectobacillus ponti]MCP8968369.1 aminodeoxychorismate/anthranilate synthase component II [Ectobacillus ponti]
MILLLDNYDSFTFNLYQLLGMCGEEVKIVRNDRITMEEIQKMNPKAIVLSPGPGRPEDAGICIQVIQNLGNSVPILGICLGHQAMVHAYGGKVVRAGRVKHGKTSLVKHSGTSIFRYVKQPFTAMRYHSLVAEQSTLPEVFDVLATSMDDGEVMAIKHHYHPLFGLQFHPESIATEEGKKLLQEFLTYANKEAAV